MVRLGCGVTNCVYNQAHRCCKGDIMVGGREAQRETETCCESFSDKAGALCVNMVERPGESIHVDCQAVRCRYNADYRCTAEQISIQGDNADTSRDTLCATFAER